MSSPEAFINARIKKYEEANVTYREAWTDFEEKHSVEINRLEYLREERNAILDDVKRAIKAETKLMSDERATFEMGPFKVQKRWSSLYNAEKLIDMLKQHQLLELAIQEGIITLQPEKYDKVKNWLDSKGLASEFEICEDGREYGTAISGPKAIPSMGAELPRE